MSKTAYKKAKEKKLGLIDLGDGYKLIVPEKSDSLKIMVACGVLISLLAQADKDNGCNKDKFKKMMNAYIDSIYDDGKLPEGLGNTNTNN